MMASAYCIIAGAPRSATTSLFKCLSSHELFAPSSLKQTLFFMDSGYQGTLLKKREEDYTLDDYMMYFPSELKNKITLEATPDYIYSDGAAGRIYNCLGADAFIVFVLRNPLDRLLSCYHHEKQVGSISGGVTVNDFVAGDDVAAIGASIHVRQGVYSKFLKEYYRVFGRDRVCVLFTDDLTSIDSTGMRALADCMDVDLSSVASELLVRSNQRFQNRSKALLTGYRVLRGTVLSITSKNRVLSKVLSTPVKLGASIYRRANHAASVPVDELAARKIELLNQYYYDGNRELADLTGRDVPWS